MASRTRLRQRPMSAASVWLIAAAVASGLMLAIAHGFEIFGHLPPCELCLHQREGYWAALWIAVAGIAATRVRPSTASPLATLVGLVFLVEAGLAAYHVGVEWKWWPGPTSCTGRHTAVTAADMAHLLASAKIYMAPCDQAAWRFLGLSMAGWNALAALGLAAGSFASVLMSRTRPLRRTL